MTGVLFCFITDLHGSAMYLYLRYGDSLELISGVVLKDGYRPMVGEVGHDLQLEPAIWFKSLIIDAILIDCDRRQVRWSRLRVKPGDRVSEEIDDVSILCEPDNVIKAKQFESSVFEDYDYSELDPKAQEIFEATKQLLVNTRKRELSTAQYKTELLRLLHCYIMPSISLTTDDIPNLENALSNIKNQIQNIDKIILKKDRAVQLTESSMTKQREAMLEREDFTSEAHILSCNPKFLPVFEKQIGKDVEETWQVIDVIQKKVNVLKQENNSSAELRQVRKERDECHEKWVKLKSVHETLKLVRREDRKKSKRSVKGDAANVFHNLYIEINDRLQEEKEEIHKLCLHKVQISSVREAIELALDDLRTEGQTFGWQIKSDGTVEHDTDVIGMNTKPRDWYTLEETISSILADVTKDVTQRHIRFCAGIRDKISSVLKESELFRDTVEPTFSIPEDEEQNVPRRQDSVYRSLTEAIKREVNEHLLNMVELLSQVIPEHSRFASGNSNLSGKIAITYHNHLSHKIMEPLEALYDRAYGGTCGNVFNKIKDMSFEELGIDEPWIRCLNNSPVPVHLTEVKCPDAHVSVTSSHSITSGLSLMSIGKMPIDKLYQLAEKERVEVQECLEAEMSVYPTEDAELTQPKGLFEGSSTNMNCQSQPSFAEAPPSYEESLNLPPSYDEHIAPARAQGVQEEGQTLYDILQPGLDLVHTLVRESSISGKLKMITKTYRFVGDQVSALKSAASLQDFMGCCDELLTLLIVLLTYLDEGDFKRLFIQMYLILDMKPQCMQGGVHDCSLTNFFAAFQYLQERLVMQTVRRSKNEIYVCDSNE